MQLYHGIVENRSDPLQLGRCQVRIVGLHTHDKSLLPTNDLPWATPMQPISSAAMNGIGSTPIGPVEGTAVIVTFFDDNNQMPVMLGTLGGISSPPATVDFDDSGPIRKSKKIEEVKLRTVAGPTTGVKLEFYDPEYGSTTITSSLEANMLVYGYGIKEGTFIVSVDSGTTITISNPVSAYGENIIDFKPAPSNLGAVAESSNTNLKGGTGENAAETPKATPTNSAIPTIPPPKSVSNQTKAAEGIKALIAACDKVGLTTKEQKCALLGIAGGESGWIPQNESYIYSAARLKQIYSFATEADIEKYSNANKKGISREEFFSWAYGPTKRGKGFLGNLTDEDGGKYYGRGFIQLTGRANYKKYNDQARAMGIIIDIVNFPDQLDLDINTSAVVAALYIKDRVSKGVNVNAHPDYFYAAKKAVGVNSPDIAVRKLNYYEYFYGSSASGGAVKDAGAPIPENTDTTDGPPGPSKQSIETGSYGLGFRDPNNKYPLQDYLNEPDTNRLARGIINGTAITKKDASRVYGIPTAAGTSWDQPAAPFGAKYPYNKVFETEAGHLQEWDDTPGQERVHTYHRSGTFTEVDANGTQVNYIVGDNFILMESNGCIHVAGDCNITADGNVNIYARTDANIKVAANANIEVGNNVSLGVANDMSVAVGGDFLLNAAGSIKMQSADISVKSTGNLGIQADGDLNAKAAGTYNLESAGEMNILSGGTMHVDYSEGQFGNGAGSAADVASFELAAPAAGDPLNPSVPYLVAPERQFEEKSAVETPEEWDTPEGRAIAATTARTEGTSGAPAPVADESSQPTGGSSSSTKVDCSIIFNTKDFTNDYKISKNFSLGMLIDGGVGGKHRLTDQMLKPHKSASERLYTVQEIVCNLAHAAQNVLEPALDLLPGGRSGFGTQWRINSGYRLRGITPNESPSSDHCKGHCFDIGLLLPDKNTKTYELIQKLEKVIPYDQLILEYRHPTSVWIHVGYKPENNRKMAFTMVNDATFARDKNGNPSGFHLIGEIPPKGK